MIGISKLIKGSTALPQWPLYINLCKRTLLKFHAGFSSGTRLCEDLFPLSEAPKTTDQGKRCSVCYGYLLYCDVVYNVYIPIHIYIMFSTAKFFKYRQQ